MTASSISCDGHERTLPAQSRRSTRLCPGQYDPAHGAFIPEENFLKRVDALFNAAAARRSARTRRVIARRGSGKIFVSGQLIEADPWLQLAHPRAIAASDTA